MGPEVDIAHPFQELWQVQPTHPMTHGRHRPPLPGPVADIAHLSWDPQPVASSACPTLDLWRTSLTGPWPCGGAGSHVPKPIAGTDRPSQEPWQTSLACPGTNGRPGWRIPGHVTDIVCPSRDPWQAWPARPGTRDEHCLPVRRPITAREWDMWQALLAYPRSRGGHRPPIPGHVAGRPTCPIPTADIGCPSQDPRYTSYSRINHPPIPELWWAQPTCLGTREGRRPPTWDAVWLGANISRPSRPSPDWWRAQPTHPGTCGGHHPPVPGTVADIAHPSGYLDRRTSLDLGWPSLPVQGPQLVCPGTMAGTARPSQDLWPARPSRPGTQGGHGQPFPKPVAGQACPSWDPWRARPEHPKTHGGRSPPVPRPMAGLASTGCPGKRGRSSCLACPMTCGQSSQARPSRDAWPVQHGPPVLGPVACQARPAHPGTYGHSGPANPSREQWPVWPGMPVLVTVAGPA
ncbi:basic salivary proline-rich protein 3-like [Macrobrachium nipponense]|uniref:basic salivary proline-rich protein 3-like n=1 Tax=Macrobrachium nipponense TaxID=159736 RepID=UPI0030C8C96E